VRNLMAARVRITPANIAPAAALIGDCCQAGVPVLVMHMRYYDKESLLAMLGDTDGATEADYESRQHILNTSYQPSAALKRHLDAIAGVGRPGVYLCDEKLCADCGQCEALYHLCKRRLNYAM
jgi:hypothetical protein